MRATSLLLLLLLGGVSLAGCANRTGSDDPPSVPAEWFQCRWTHADGQAVDCDGESVQALRYEPEGLERCVFESGPGEVTFAIHQDLASGRYWLRFESTVTDVNVSGMVGLTFGDTIHVYNWSRQGRAAVLWLPGLPGTPDFVLNAVPEYLQFNLYHSELVTEDPRLVGQPLHEAWSIRPGPSAPEGDWNAVRRVGDPAAPYLFYERVPTPFGGATGGVSFSMVQDGYDTTFGIRVLASGGYETVGCRIVPGAES
jgi:hypothetical protein